MPFLGNNEKIKQVINKPAKAEQGIPEQHSGFRKEFVSSRKFITLGDAKLCFCFAADRMLEINNWNRLVAMKTTFTIRDRDLKREDRPARLLDFVAIEIPGPENVDGQGCDWVQVVQLKGLKSIAKEQLLLTLRPSPMPGSTETSHFFSSRSTSSFLLTRREQVVSAAYYGHNELPNTAVAATSQLIRNVAVAAGAILGFSDVIWKPLITSFIMDEQCLRDKK